MIISDFILFFLRYFIIQKFISVTGQTEINIFPPKDQ